MKYESFNQLIERLPEIEIKNFGIGSVNGFVHDLTQMGKSKATIVLKDYGAVCNCVTRSLSLGVPVLMDRETYQNGYYDSIDGLFVFDSIDDIEKMIVKMNGDYNFLKSVFSVVSKSEWQFKTDKEYGEDFIGFLSTIINHEKQNKDDSHSPEFLRDLFKD